MTPNRPDAKVDGRMFIDMVCVGAYYLYKMCVLDTGLMFAPGVQHEAGCYQAPVSLCS